MKILPGVVGFFLLMISAHQLSAQEVVALLQLERKEPRPILFEYVKDDGGLVTIASKDRTSLRELSIYKYDAAFKRTWTRDLFEQQERRQLESLLVLGSRILVFYSELDAREDIIHLYLTQYDLSGNPIKTAEEIASSINETKLRSIFDFSRSVDRKRIMAIGQLNPPKSDREFDESFVKLTYVLFDLNVPGIVKGETEIPYFNENYDLRMSEVGNDGTIWLMGAHLPKGRENGTEDYNYLVFKLDPRARVLKEIKLDFGSNIVTDLILKPDRDNNAVLAGFYSTQRNDQFIGILYARIQSPGDTLSVASYERFSNQFLINFLTPGQIERGRELQNLFLDNIVLRSDGGALILAEEFYITTSGGNIANPYGLANPYSFGYNPYNYGRYGNTGYNNFTGRTFFHYDKIAAISVSPGGRIEWTSIVQKSQTSDSKTELSYVPLIGPERLIFVYKGFERGAGNNVYFSEVDYEGRSGVPKPFFERFSSSNVFYRAACEQISNSEAIVVYYEGGAKSFTLAKVSF